MSKNRLASASGTAHTEQSGNHFMQRHPVFLAGLVLLALSAARLIAQAPADNGDGPDEAGKEFMAYLARQDFESLKNIVASDSFRQLGDAGVDALLHDLRLVPDHWTATADSKGEASVTPIFEARPVVCAREGAFWRVDAIATAARWRKLDATAGPHQLVREYSTLPQFGPESRATCLTNLQSIAIAMRQYQQDYKDEFPPAPRWNDCLAPYVRLDKAFHCPAAGKQSYGYAMNTKLPPRPPAAASALAVIYETATLERNAHNDGHDLVFRHEDRTHTLFSDGTVRPIFRPRKPPFQLPAAK